MNEKLKFLEKSNVSPKTLENFIKYIPDIKDQEHQELVKNIFEGFSNHSDIKVSTEAKKVLAYFNNETLKALDNFDIKEKQQSSLISMQVANNSDFVGDYKRGYRSAS